MLYVMKMLRFVLELVICLVVENVNMIFKWMIMDND